MKRGLALLTLLVFGGSVGITLTLRAAMEKLHGAKKYICPPCERSCDKEEFDAAGECPKCGMTLAEKGQGAGYETIYNFRRVTPEFFTGGQPRLEHLAELKAAGVKAIVNLRVPTEHRAADEEAEAKRVGLRYFNIPVVFANPKDEEVTEFLKLTDDSANRPMFVHCTAAIRVGAFWMIRRVLRDGWTVDKAEEEATQVGLRQSPHLNEFARKYIDAHKNDSKPARGKSGEAASENEIRDVLGRYLAALNRYDADAVASFYAADAVRIRNGGREPIVRRDPWRGYREFEAVTHATFDFEIRSIRGDRADLLMTEDNDFYQALGTGVKSTAIIFTVRNGQFHEVDAQPSTDAGRPYGPALQDFKSWSLKERPMQAAAIVRNGDLTFDAQTANPMVKLAREWRKAGS
ncbi:MAG: hypothetical protein HY046_03635 [Acidobacteria bacterium]|nr:hypothetical protein [Acidobacteriota bacterium]